MKFIDNLRERSEEERLAAALGAAIVVALILFLFWSISLFSGSNPMQTNAGRQSASAVSSLDTRKQEISDSVDEFSEQYRKLKTALSETDFSSEPPTVNTVKLYTDNDGAVHVDNIIIQKSELRTR